MLSMNVNVMAVDKIELRDKCIIATDYEYLSDGSFYETITYVNNEMTRGSRTSSKTTTYYNGDENNYAIRIKSMKYPKCGKDYEGIPAMSRVDNKTNICPKCGFIEALEAAGYSKEEMRGQLKAFDDSAGKYYRLS